MRSNKIIFKSRSDFFYKEKMGIKPNTIREIDLSDERFIKLISIYHQGFNPGDLKIIIQEESPFKSGDFFERDINDISIYKNWIILSWCHK